MVEVRPARLTDVGPIANAMRAMDRMECEAFGRTPRQALRAGLLNSEEAWTALVDGRPAAMFGCVVVSAIGGVGSPWMLGTDAVYRHGRELLRWGPAFLSRMVDSTPSVSNLVSAFNARAIRLLRAWGFSVGSEAILIGGVPFYRFWRHG